MAEIVFFLSPTYKLDINKWIWSRPMGKLNDIKQKLLSGATANELIKQGFAKFSVHLVVRKLKKLQPDTYTSPVQDELRELRQ